MGSNGGSKYMALQPRSVAVLCGLQQKVDHRGEPADRHIDSKWRKAGQQQHDSMCTDSSPPGRYTLTCMLQRRCSSFQSRQELQSGSMPENPCHSNSEIRSCAPPPPPASSAASLRSRSRIERKAIVFLSIWWFRRRSCTFTTVATGY